MSQNKRKYQYSINLLEDILKKNQDELVFWNEHMNSKEEKVIRQAKGNIGSCESRIEAITIGIKILNGEINLL